MLYDHFLGDTSCVHCVLFNLEDSLDEQMAQVIFWLNFLKARIHPEDAHRSVLCSVLSQSIWRVLFFHSLSSVFCSFTVYLACSVLSQSIWRVLFFHSLSSVFCSLTVYLACSVLSQSI